MAEFFGNSLFNDANCQHYYRFEDNSNDSKGAINGTDSGVTYTASGKYNKGASFDGTDDKITLTNAASLNSTNFTYVCWINITNNTVARDVFASEAVANVRQWYIGTDGKQALAKTAVANLGFSDSVVPTGALHHIAVTYDGTTVKFYLNGAADGSTASSQTFDTVTRTISSNTNDFLGVIDDLVVFDRVLTAAEILTIYQDATGGYIFIQS